MNNNANLNEKIEVVAYTNEEGVASYSYTRYYKYNDNVTAYATEKSSVYASGKVYWAEGLSLTEVTTGNELANGAKKVYKIKTDSSLTAKTAAGVEYKYVNVAFVENNNVTPDKLVRDVEVLDAGVYSDATYTQAKYPSQVTTGGVQTVRVKVNADGEATFTLTGANASVTPIVFVDDTTNATGKYTATALQATAPTVKFALSHTLGLTVKAEGVQNAAATTAKGEGGRDYTVTLTDSKTGKVAPEGAEVRVTFPKGSISKDKAVTLVTYDKNGNEAGRVLVTEKSEVSLQVFGSKGEAKFKLIGAKDAFATPTVYVENDKTAGFSSDDLQTVGETTYFVDALVNKSKLSTFSSKDLTDETTTIGNGENALFVYESVDQNGFPYYSGNGTYEVTYQVSPQFADVTVSGSGLTTTVIKKGTTQSVKVQAVNGKATLTVVQNETVQSSTVSVSASSSQISLEDQPATVTFSKYSSTVVSGKATTAGTDELIINGALYSYSGATYKYNGSVITKAQFKEYVAGNTATVSVTKDDEGKLTFNIINLAASENTKEGLQAAIVSAQAKHDAAVQGNGEGQYPAPAKATLQAAITAAIAVYNNGLATPTQVADANKTLAAAVKAFEATKVGNQKAALATKLADAKTLANSVKAFGGTGSFATDAKANEVQAQNLTALTTAISTTEVLLADTGAVSADFGAQLTVLDTTINNVKSDLVGYNNAKAALQNAITNAERAHSSAVSGQGNGEYAAADKAALLNAINVAKVILNDVTTTVSGFGTTATGPLKTLNDAKTAFDATVISHTVTVTGSTSLLLTFTSSTGLVVEDGVTADIALDTASTATVATGKPLGI